MRLGLIITCLLLISCSQAPPLRGPASAEEDIFYGEIDTKKSVVKVFPPEVQKDNVRYFFFLELKDLSGKHVDCDPSEITLKRSNGQKVAFQVERSMRGKFYVTMEETTQISQLKLKVFIRNVPLKQEVKLLFKKADQNKSWLKAVRSERNGIKLRLFLGDSKGKPVEVPSEPEIVIEGNAQILNLERVSEGTWEFEVVYPNYNQVIYISVRAHGKYMPNMFRIQNIER